MKILGWILTIIGSNGLTGTLVAKESIRYDTGVLADIIIERVMEILGAEQGILSALLAAIRDNLRAGLVEILGVDQEYVQMIDLLFYISVGILSLGIIFLAVGYIRGAIQVMKRRQTHETERQDVDIQTMCINCNNLVPGNFCPACGQKAEHV